MRTDYIHKIVKASGVAASETVLIHFWGEDSEKEIANAFLVSVASLGATPVLLQQSRSCNHAIFEKAKEACFAENYFDMFSHFDAVLDVFAYRPIILGYPLPPEQMALYRRYISQLFYALMKAKRFAQIRIPTAANAEEASLEPDVYIRRMEKAYDLDYDALGRVCENRKSEMAQFDRYILRTGVECSLYFDLTGRQWQIDAGDGDWPCGEIYIAPVEQMTHGKVFFEKLFLEEAGAFERVTLQVEDGKITGSDHEAVTAFLQTLSPEQTVICELGLGMNPNVTDLCGYTALDEKMAGSFHIAIGANTMFGGRNDAKTHMDFVSSGRFSLLPVK
ncbi:MAG: aminopeptidase [Peptococcaceae bacterium]|nr:aminopeptidase [Peptococcaceae bacterium]